MSEKTTLSQAEKSRIKAEKIAASAIARQEAGVLKAQAKRSEAELLQASLESTKPKKLSISDRREERKAKKEKRKEEKDACMTDAALSVEIEYTVGGLRVIIERLQSNDLAARLASTIAITPIRSYVVETGEETDELVVQIIGEVINAADLISFKLSGQYGSRAQELLLEISGTCYPEVRIKNLL
jgi:hypothetical protein